MLQIVINHQTPNNNKNKIKLYFITKKIIEYFFVNASKKTLKKIKNLLQFIK
jgi:IS1 family transposase